MWVSVPKSVHMQSVSETRGWQQPTGFQFNFISHVALLKAEKDLTLHFLTL